MASFVDKTLASLGFIDKTVGKTQARKEFFPLVDSLSSDNSAVEITDHDEPVAVLMSYQNYVALIAKAYLHSEHLKAKTPDLKGSISISTNLDAASAKIANILKGSVDESAGNL